MITILSLLGFLSAYALNPTIGTLEIRQEWGQLPEDLSGYEVFLAVNDCALIGQEATLAIGGDTYRALVFDCAGADAYEDGQSWMELRGVVAEVDYWFWVAHPEYVGSEVYAEVVFSG